jgi:hypothetical protein
VTEKVMVELPEELAQRARAFAVQTHQRFEDVLVDWIGRGGAEPAVELLSDDQILAQCDSQMGTDQQEELSDLLACHREGTLAEPDRHRLDELMQVYRRGLVRKAQAWKMAVARGLRPQLDDDGTGLHPH